MTHESQRLRILRWLASGETLTNWQAIRKWHFSTASQRVTEIRRQFPVNTRRIKLGRALVAEWSIPPAVAARARKMLGAV